MPYLSDKDVEEEFEKKFVYNDNHKTTWRETYGLPEREISALKFFLRTIRAKDREALKNMVEKMTWKIQPTRERQLDEVEQLEAAAEILFPKFKSCLLHSLDNLSK